MAASMPPHGPAARPTAALWLARCLSEERIARKKGCLPSFCSRYFETQDAMRRVQRCTLPLGCANNDEAMAT